MSTINERIRAIAAYYDINSYAEFARITDLGHQVVSNYFKGRQRPDVRKLSKIQEAFDEIDAHWLVTGEGDMFKKQVHINPGCSVNYGMDEQDRLSKLSTASITRYLTEQGAGDFRASPSFTHHIQELVAEHNKILSRHKQVKPRDQAGDDKPTDEG